MLKKWLIPAAIVLIVSTGLYSACHAWFKPKATPAKPTNKHPKTTQSQQSAPTEQPSPTQHRQTTQDAPVATSAPVLTIPVVTSAPARPAVTSAAVYGSAVAAAAVHATAASSAQQAPVSITNQAVQSPSINRNYLSEYPNIFKDVPADYKPIVCSYIDNTIDLSSRGLKRTGFTLTENELAEINRGTEEEIRWFIYQAVGEYFKLVPMPEQGYITFSGDLYRGDLFQGQRNSYVLKDFCNNRTPYSIAHQLVNNYKIHLMPTESEIIYVFTKLLEELKTDTELRRHVHAFKIKYAITENDPQKMAHVVIYPASSKESAQYVLNVVYKLFGARGGTGECPRFSKQITGLISYAQGDGDYKYYPDNDRFYEPDLVHYRPDFTGHDVGNGYHLKNPAN